VMRRVTHAMDWGQTPSGKRFAACSCGWRAPVRSKLTHGMSDVRDHLRDVRKRQDELGLGWWMVRGAGLVTEELEPEDELARDQVVGEPGVSLPHDVGPA
jgi:hypothetical protein